MHRFCLLLILIALIPGAPMVAKAELDTTDADHLAEIRRLIDGARANDDGARLAQAKTMLAEIPPSPDGRLLSAVIRQMDHDFAGALEDLDAVLDARPNDPQARLSRAFVNTTLGRHDQARADCRALPIRTGQLVIAACRAWVASLTGRAEPSYQLLNGLVADGGDADPNVRSWVHTILADIASRLGEVDEAEAHWNSALALGPGQIRTLVGYADFLIRAGRPEDAHRLLDDPDLVASDHILFLRAHAAKQAGLDYQEPWSILEERLNEDLLIGETGHTREQGLAMLRIGDDPELALDLAQLNWREQKEPVDARLLLEAALAAGDDDALRTVRSWYEATGLEDQAVQTLLADSARTAF
ncbi:MAG: tetratricopeptide repeat protein [Geminicoccaceae bacterium]